MSRFLAGAAVGVIVVGAAAYVFVHHAALGGGSGSNAGRLPRSPLEWTVLSIGYDNGVCKMMQKAPGPIRSARGRAVHWVIEGTCPDGHTIAIDRNFMRNGQTVDILQPGPLDSPARAGGPPITATIKGDADSADYRYWILIDGKHAQYASEADPGDFSVCPWPCT